MVLQVDPQSSEQSVTGPLRVSELIGVYDADGSVVGEIRYWVGARFGRSHCSLCDITHGTFRERSEWRAFRDILPVEFTTCHRDDAPADVIKACGANFPVVLARVESEIMVLLDEIALDALGGDVDRLGAAIADRCAELGLVLDSDPGESQARTSP
jgi:hypothetical protein